MSRNERCRLSVMFALCENRVCLKHTLYVHFQHNPSHGQISSGNYWTCFCSTFLQLLSINIHFCTSPKARVAYRIPGINCRRQQCTSSICPSIRSASADNAASQTCAKMSPLVFPPCINFEDTDTFNWLFGSKYRQTWSSLPLLSRHN